MKRNPAVALPVVLGLGAVVLGAYIVFKKKSDTSPLPQTTSQPLGAPPETPIRSTMGSETPPQQAQPGRTPPAAVPSLENRLIGSRAARQIFNIQAVAYATGFSDAVPDGLWGPITQGIVNRAEDALYLRRTTGLVPETLQRVRIAGQALGQTPRALPLTLSGRVLTALTNDAAIADYQAMSYRVEAIA